MDLDASRYYYFDELRPLTEKREICLPVCCLHKGVLPFRGELLHIVAYVLHFSADLLHFPDFLLHFPSQLRQP